MATCHSLRVVDDELLGDPLDVKMFQFTGWSYEEGGGNISEHPNLSMDTITPSIARPPSSETYIINQGPGSSVSYCVPTLLINSLTNLFFLFSPSFFQLSLLLNLEFCEISNLYRNYAVPV